MIKAGILIITFLFASTVSSGDQTESTLLDGNYQSSQIPTEVAQTGSRRRALPAKRNTRRVRKSMATSPLSVALANAKSGQYAVAAQQLFRLSLDPRYKKQRIQIRYILGMMLYQMKFYQLSAFQFISVIKSADSKYLKQSLAKLSLVADNLGDDTLLNYAIARIQVEKFPRTMRDMLYYRIGEYQLRAKSYANAINSFSRVGRTSNLFEKAKYSEGLAYAERGEVPKALAAFNDLYDNQTNKPVTDPARVSALVGAARIQYQGKNWDKAIELYRQVPRDTEIWHDTLFESSWAMLRSGMFRSAISNFQTIHSSFYDNFYQPEALLLRSIVYLYICQYDEMEKVLNLFNTLYMPVYKDVKEYLKKVRLPSELYDDVENMMTEFKDLGDELDKSKFNLPFVVGRQISKEGDYKRTRHYIGRIKSELDRLYQMSDDWKNSPLGRYAERTLKTRLDKSKKKAGRQLRHHLGNIRFELFDLFEQEGFIRYEMLNGKKQAVKKRVAGKGLPRTVDENAERDFYVQNGYQYWPFDGEYWLDELGNYHYVGTQSCE